MQLTKNFTLEEMLRSGKASEMNILEQYNPSDKVIENLRLLCEHIIQPLRDYLGPISVSSGYRCERVNKLVGGSNSSQHKTGQAADLKMPMGNHFVIFDAVKHLNLPFDQMIWEFGNDKNPAWVHVSYSSKHRRQILYLK